MHTHQHVERATRYRSSKLGISGYHRIVPPDRARVRLTLERRIDEGLADEEDVMIYEVITDPEVRMAEKQQRTREGQYKRRIRRRAARGKGSSGALVGRARCMPDTKVTSGTRRVFTDSLRCRLTCGAVVNEA